MCFLAAASEVLGLAGSRIAFPRENDAEREKQGSPREGVGDGTQSNGKECTKPAELAPGLCTDVSWPEEAGDMVIWHHCSNTGSL